MTPVVEELVQVVGSNCDDLDLGGSMSASGEAVLLIGQLRHRDRGRLLHLEEENEYRISIIYKERKDVRAKALKI